MQSILSGMDLNNFFNSGNSSNLYISPMNNSSLYDPSKAKEYSNISSAFFPIVKID